jgi:cytochrome c peroxidase
MRSTTLAAASLLMLTASAARADDLMTRSQAVFKPIPAVAPMPKDNPASREKVELGRMLFFEPRLSTSEIISCGTCHNVSTGGVDAGPTSVGHGWQKGPRRAPTVLNAVFNVAQFWDGRAADLKAQAKGPVQAAVEMNASPEHVVKTLNSMPEYVARFKKAFGDEADPVTFDNMARAIETFEATLITPGSRFDRFLTGDARVLSAEEKQGLKTFMDKGCSNCHNGINVGGGAYFRFGLVRKPSPDILPAGDKGRAVVTKDPNDEYVFRVAPLRNVALQAPYFHTGQVWSLSEARVLQFAYATR